MEYKGYNDVQYLVSYVDDQDGNCYEPEWVGSEFLKLDHNKLIV
jgi:hypothetical protein